MTRLLEIFTNSLETADVRPAVPENDDTVTREELVTLFAKDLENNQASIAEVADQE